MPEHSIVFCLCNSVGAFIGRPHGEPPFPIREDSMILKTHIMPERNIVILRTTLLGRTSFAAVHQITTVITIR